MKIICENILEDELIIRAFQRAKRLDLLRRFIMGAQGVVRKIPIKVEFNRPRPICGAEGLALHKYNASFD